MTENEIENETKTETIYEECKRMFDALVESFDYAPPAVPLASEVREKYEGMPAPALDLILKCGASERASARALATKELAIEWAKQVCHEESEQGEFALTALLALFCDVGGIGGERGISGAATCRMEPFSRLGKGRWQASDGGAWRRAALDAIYGLKDGLSSVRLTTTEFGRLLMISVPKGKADHDDETLYGTLGVAVHPEWSRCVAGRALVALHSGQNYLKANQFEVRSPCIFIDEDIAKWAACYSVLTEGRPDGR